MLNAKSAQEAEIVAQAGRKGATIATNMAGRGTDACWAAVPSTWPANRRLRRSEEQRLLHSEKVVDDEEFVYFFHVDRFFRVPRPDWERIFTHFTRRRRQNTATSSILADSILGTERHEARRIDNQLRGRAGGQGDPGSSHFLSLEDDLMRIFGSEISGRSGGNAEEGVPIEHGMVTRAIERAQRQVEARAFVRKHLLEYDDVMNKQREE